jgi:hypothetical protein
MKNQMVRAIIGLSLTLSIFSPAILAQNAQNPDNPSLGDLARQERERKKNQAPSKVVLTNDGGTTPSGQQPPLDAPQNPAGAARTSQVSPAHCLRILNTAVITYSSTFNLGFPTSLSALGPPKVQGTPPSQDSAGLIDEILASGAKGGYVFTYSAGKKDANGRVNTYTVRVDPLPPVAAGQKHYFTDESGVIRQENDKPANSSSAPFREDEASQHAESDVPVAITGNEEGAIGSLKALNVAEIEYLSTFNRGYSPDLKSLGGVRDPSNPSESAAGLIDIALASGKKFGYTFTYKVVSKIRNGVPATYELTARPDTYGQTGKSNYFTDQTGVIRVTQEDRVATAMDPSISEANAMREAQVNEGGAAGSQNTLKNEAGAIGSMRFLNTAETTYAATFNKGFSPDLKSLGESGPTLTESGAGMIDEALASGKKSGYTFTYTVVSKDANGAVTAYEFTARPDTYGKSGKSSYFTDQSGVIRATQEDRAATANDPPYSQ